MQHLLTLVPFLNFSTILQLLCTKHSAGCCDYSVGDDQVHMSAISEMLNAISYKGTEEGMYPQVWNYPRQNFSEMTSVS